MLILGREKGSDFSLSDCVSLIIGQKNIGNYAGLLCTRAIYPKKTVNSNFNKIISCFHSFHMLFVEK